MKHLNYQTHHDHLDYKVELSNAACLRFARFLVLLEVMKYIIEIGEKQYLKRNVGNSILMRKYDCLV